MNLFHKNLETIHWGVELDGEKWPSPSFMGIRFVPHLKNGNKSLVVVVVVVVIDPIKNVMKALYPFPKGTHAPIQFLVYHFLEFMGNFDYRPVSLVS